jgi:hypothetical protein
MRKELVPQSRNTVEVISAANEGEWSAPVNPKRFFIESWRQETRQPSAQVMCSMLIGLVFAPGTEQLI